VSTHPSARPATSSQDLTAGRPSNLATARPSTQPRRQPPMCHTRPHHCPAVRPPHVCPTAPNPDAGCTTQDAARRLDTWACSATGASSPTSVPPPRTAPPTARTCSRPTSTPPVSNSGAPPHKVSAPPCCQVSLDRAPR
jgi:hypothetical protein